MNHWQTILSLFIVLMAVLWIIRRTVRTIRSGLKGMPGNCGTCSMNKATKKENNLVQLGVTPSPKK